MRCLPCVAIWMALAGAFVLAGTPNEGVWLDGGGLTRDLRDAAANRSHVVERFRAQRLELIGGLIAILRESKESLSTRIAAVKILGALRAEEAVGPLIENLTISPEFNTESTIQALYPAAYALAVIGKPGSKAALLSLGQSNNDRRRKLLCEVIRRVEGETVGRFMVKEAIGNTSDTAVAANLRAALVEFRGE